MNPFDAVVKRYDIEDGEDILEFEAYEAGGDWLDAAGVVSRRYDFFQEKENYKDDVEEYEKNKKLIEAAKRLKENPDFILLMKKVLNGIEYHLDRIDPKDKDSASLALNSKQLIQHIRGEIKRFANWKYPNTPKNPTS